jgi:hypothetical protein
MFADNGLSVPATLDSSPVSEALKAKGIALAVGSKVGGMTQAVLDGV